MMPGTKHDLAFEMASVEEEEEVCFGNVLSSSSTRVSEVSILSQAEKGLHAAHRSAVAPLTEGAISISKHSCGWKPWPLAKQMNQRRSRRVRKSSPVKLVARPNSTRAVSGVTRKLLKKPIDSQVFQQVGPLSQARSLQDHVALCQEVARDQDNDAGAIFTAGRCISEGITRKAPSRGSA